MARIKRLGQEPLVRRPGFENELLEHMDSLMAFVLSFTKSKATAEDVCQETFIKALTRQDLYTPGSNLKAWLFTIARNEWRSFLRKRRREQPLDNAIIENMPAERKEFNFETEYDFAYIVPFLASIPQEQSDALIAIHYLAWSYEETAQRLQVEVGTMKSRVSRALRHVDRLRQSQEIESYDLSSWATASNGIPSEHPYYPIAHAYETIYAFMLAHASPKLTKQNSAEPKPLSEVDELYRALRDSGELDEYALDLETLMQTSEFE